MPRIPPAELDRLKQDVSLQRLVESRGVLLERHGKDLMGLCPFHNDTSPSLVVSSKQNLWHCLGACQQGGSVIDWVMKSEGVSFRHAVELLRDESSSFAAPGERIVKKCSVPKLAPVIATDADDQAALRQVIAHYHETLKQSPEAQAYLDKRGINHPEAVEHFRLGYANRTLGYRLPNNNRKEGAELRGRLQRLGILRDSGHEHFRGSLVIPIIDAAGNVLEVYGRKIGGNLRKGTALHVYLPGTHRGVFNLQGINGHRDVILCESLIDALTFWCAGHRNVTASYGVQGFTDEHLKAVSTGGPRSILIAYDRDAAGDNAAAKLAEQLMADGHECFRVLFPRGMDANDYAQSVRGAKQALQTALRGATWLGKGPAPSVQGAALQANEGSGDTNASAGTSAQPPPEPPAPLAAESAPAAETLTPQLTPELDEARYTIGDRRWRIRGLKKNTSFDVLRINLLCARGERFFVDTLDIYAARLRAAFIRQAGNELRIEPDILKADLAQLLSSLEQLQERTILEASAPKNPQPEMTHEQREEALALLRDPKLLDRIVTDFERCGIVGERTNKLVGYLAAVSRKLRRPLAIIIQSSSAAGKSSLMDAILDFVPEEERVKYSAMTGQSLFYMGEEDVRHRILAIVEEEGASRAAYALKLLLSEGELTIASAGKDPVSGRQVTHVYHVEGPVMIFLTTTAVELNDELRNRCLVLTVDEARAQTQAIHRAQRYARTLDGLFAQGERDDVLAMHRNAQRLLRPLPVLNPYAEQLTFVDDRTRTRRDHPKYLALIDTIALLHQYQRKRKRATRGDREVEYIEVTREDIVLANRIAHEVLGRSLDELPPQSRRLLGVIEAMVSETCERLGTTREHYRFSRRELREHSGLGDTQLKVHLGRLVELEYVIAHRALHGRGLVYELAYDGGGGNGQLHLPGLIDPSALVVPHVYDSERSGPEGQRSVGGRPMIGGQSGGGRGAANGTKLEHGAAAGKIAEIPPPATTGGTSDGRSYVNAQAQSHPRAGEVS